MSRLGIAVGALGLLSGCAAPPEVDVTRFDGRIPAAPAGYPVLGPIPIAASAPSAPAAAAVPGRAAELRARAAALRGPVIPPADRTRLDEARR